MTPTTVITATGKLVDLGALWGDPRPVRAAIDAADIASALAKVCRFNGATSRPYSVAEHSLHVAWVMEVELGITEPLPLLCGLLHDAHEAYTGDLTTPAQAWMGFARADGTSIWQFFARSVQRQVAARFGIRPEQAEAWAAQVKQADEVMCATELRDLFPGTELDITRRVGTRRVSQFLHLGDFESFTWQDWRDTWLERLDELRCAVVQQRLDDDEPGAVAQPSPACRDFLDHLDDSEGGME